VRLPVSRQHPFRPRDWPSIRAFLAGIAALHPRFDHMVAIVDSIIECDAQAQLAACTSMHDLIVVVTPVPDPPYDVIRVCSPSSLRPVPPDMVMIEYLAATGNNDRIVRPADDAVPLFWAFVREKYGISAAHRARREGI
jgi:hypothetical protein